HLRSRSLGAPLLQEFASGLASAMLAPFLKACETQQPGFEFRWRNTEPVVRRLLNLKNPSLAGWAAEIPWPTFLDHVLARAAIALLQRHRQPLHQLSWGSVRKRSLSGPMLEAVFRGLAGRLALPTDGDEDCVMAVG